MIRVPVALRRACSRCCSLALLGALLLGLGAPAAIAQKLPIIWSTYGDEGGHLDESQALSSDGRTFALADHSRGLVKVIDLATRSLKTTIVTATPNCGRLSLSPTGRFLSVWEPQSSRNGVYDVQTGRRVAEYDLGGAFQVWSPSGGSILAYYGSTIVRYDINVITGSLTQRWSVVLDGSDHVVTSIAVSADESVIGVVVQRPFTGPPGRVQLLDMANGNNVGQNTQLGELGRIVASTTSQHFYVWVGGSNSQTPTIAELNTTGTVLRTKSVSFADTGLSLDWEAYQDRFTQYEPTFAPGLLLRNRTSRTPVFIRQSDLGLGARPEVTPSAEAAYAIPAGLVGKGNYDGYLGPFAIHQRALTFVWDLYGNDYRATESLTDQAGSVIALDELPNGDILSMSWVVRDGETNYNYKLPVPGVVVRSKATGKVTQVYRPFGTAFDSLNWSYVPGIPLHYRALRSAYLLPGPEQRVLAFASGFWGDFPGRAVAFRTSNSSVVYEIPDIRSLGLSPDRTKVAVGTRDGRLVLRNAQSGDQIAEVTTIGIHRDICFSPDGSTIYVLTTEKLYKLSATNLSTLAELSLNLAFHANETRLRVSVDGSSLYLYDVFRVQTSPGQVLGQLWTHSAGTLAALEAQDLFQPITQLEPTARGYVFIGLAPAHTFSGSAIREPAKLAILDPSRSLEIVRVFQGETGSGPTSLSLSNDGKRLYVGRDDEVLLASPNPLDDRRLDLTGVTPNTVTRVSHAWLNLEGNGFRDDSVVTLVRGSTIRAAKSYRRIDQWSARAEFDLSTADLGAWDVVVSNPDNQTVALPAGVQLVASGTAAEVEFEILGQTSLRPNRTVAYYLEYANMGPVPVPAPLFTVRCENPHGKLKLDRDDLWSGDRLALLGVGQSEGDILFPGERLRVPIFYNTAQQSVLAVTRIDSLDSSYFANNWANAQPLHPPAEGQDWMDVWSRFTSRYGSTPASYMAELRRTARYLGRLGDPVHDVRDLVDVAMNRAMGSDAAASTLESTVDAAVPTPGISLALPRIAPSDYLGRRRIGPFGYGWKTPWEVRVAPYSGGTSFVLPYPFHRQFANMLDPGVEGWKGEDGDRGKLEFLNDGRAKITEINGSVAVYRTDRALDYVEDTNGNRITLGYDSSNRLATLTHSNGDSILLIYNANGHVASATDSLGRTTTYQYTGLHLTSVTYPGGRTVNYQYRANGDLIQVTYPDGTEKRFGYNGQMVLSSISMTMGMMPMNFAYPVGTDTDPTPGRAAVTNAGNATWTVDRNSLRQIAVAQDPLGNTTRVSHDFNGNVRRVVDAKGDAWGIDVDSKGNPIAGTDPLGNTLRMGFTSELNRLDWIRDRRLILTDFDYDVKGNLTRITYVDGTYEAWTYDGAGNPTSYRNRRGQSISYQYNIQGQVTSVVRSDGRTYSYTYDSRGRMTSANDTVTGSIVMTYDSRDFLTRIDYPGGRWFQYQYDNSGKRTRRTGNDGPNINYAYDAMGRFWKLTDGNANLLIEYLYDITGRLQRENKGNGSYTLYAYDAANRLTSIEHRNAGGALQARYAYQYDAVGNPIVQETPAGTFQYTYDKLGQLTSVRYPDGSLTTTTYDAEGNRLALNDGSTTNYTVNNLNQYTQVGTSTYSYDADGNLVGTTQGSGATYTYDVEGHLVGLTAAGQTYAFEYDALGNRVRTTVDGQQTNYLYDGSDLIGEYSSSGSLQARYQHGIGLVSRSDGTGVGYYGFDLTGNTRLITSSNGLVSNSYEYRPFGSLLSSSEAMTNPFTFVGRWGVRRVGALHDMRARFYDAGLGRFMRSDPIGVLGGSANSYSYVSNSPLALVDPSGLCSATFGDYGSSVGSYITMSISVGGLFGGGYSYSYPRSGIGPTFHELSSSAGWSIVPVTFALSEGSRPQTGLHSSVSGNLGIIQGELRARVFSNQRPQAGIAWTSPQLGFGMNAHYVFGGPGESRPGRICRPPSAPNNPSGTGPIERKGPATSVAVDPNEKRGPEGATERRFVPSTGEFQYDVLFENIGNAHLQELLIEDQLDPNLDWSTFKLGDIRFGNQVVSEFGGFQRGYFRVPLLAPANPELPVNPSNTHLVVDIWVTFDAASGKIRWLLKAIDPLTEEFPEGVYEGFLPPNTYQLNGETHTYEDGRGEGKMTFTIYPKAGLPEGTEIANKASIIFEPTAGGQTIVTNEWINTLDEKAPESRVLPLPAFSFDPSIFVRWAGTDLGGIANFTIYVSENGGAYTVWKEGVTDLFDTFPGISGRSYRFYSVATDLAGNVETAPTVHDAQTSLGNRVSGSATLTDYSASRFGVPVTLRLLQAGTNTVLENYQTFLGDDGYFEFGTGRTGTFDVTIKTPTHLRTKLSGVILTSSGASGLAANLLYNGDVNNDNTINIADFLALRAAFGSTQGSGNWNPRADLNGSGSVNVQDFLILRKNFGRSGE